jgi:TrmH family RNA methyltransferase
MRERIALKLIRSADNPFVRRLLGLRDSARERREEARTVIEGAHLIEAFLDNTNQLPEAVVVSEASSLDEDVGRLLERTGRSAAICLEDRLFAKLTPVAGRNGVLAIIPTIATSLVEAIGRGGFQLWLDSVQDPGNVGSLIRSAAASGAAAVVLGRGCADPWSPKCLRGGMGGHFAIPMAQVDDLGEVVRQWRGRVLVADASAGGDLFGTDLKGDTAVILGGEGAGVHADLVAMASGLVGIPMAGAVESLNVGAAGAIICFERARQILQSVRT